MGPHASGAPPPTDDRLQIVPVGPTSEDLTRAEWPTTRGAAPDTPTIKGELEPAIGNRTGQHVGVVGSAEPFRVGGVGVVASIRQQRDGRFWQALVEPELHEAAAAGTRLVPTQRRRRRLPGCLRP